MRVKFVLWIIGIGLLVGVYVSGVAKVRQQMEAALSDAFGRKATFQSAAMTFPLGVRLIDVSIPAGAGMESSVSARRVEARLDLWMLLKGQPRLDLELEGLKLLVERDTQKSLHLPLHSSGLGKIRELPLARLRLKDCRIILIDRAVSPLVFCDLQDLNLTMKSSRKPEIWSYSASGSIQGESGRPVGRLEAEGELYRSPLSEATVSVRYQRLEQLSAYLRWILGAAPSRGSLQMTSSLRFLGGELLSDNQIEAAGVVFPTDEPTTLGPSGNRLVDLLRDSQGVVRLSFTVRGRLGERLDWSNLMEATLREALQQALARNIQKTLTEAEPPRSMEEAIRRGMESLGR